MTPHPARACAVLLLLVSPLARAGEPETWPAWRGPLATGEAPGADPPVRWSEDENVAWRVELPGHGKSTPIVHGDRIFLLAATTTRAATEEELAARRTPEDLLTEAPDHIVALLALALDRRTGERLWETRVAEGLPPTGVHETNGYASFSPVTDGDGVYLTLGSFGVHALDAATGEVRWSHPLGPQVTRRGWGEGGSPALADGTLVVVADQEEPSHIVALDAATGAVRWHRDRDEPSTWTTPLVVRTGDTTQVVVNGTTAARSYDLATGDVLWHCSGQTVNAIPTPVSDGELVVCASGYRGSACMALDLDARGDLRAVDGAIAWNRTDGTPYVPSPLLVDGRVYFLAGNTGRLSCVELATGEVLLDRRHVDLGTVYASPIAAAGRLYVVGRDGTTLVLRHRVDADGGDELEVLARNELEGPIDASPVALGRTLYLRSERALYAIGRP